MINGFEQLVKLSLPQQGPDGSVQPLRIAQRMRLEAAQLDGVIKRMKVKDPTIDNRSTILICSISFHLYFSKPCGH
jgi:hypothetical protein